jgi:hypothetical protein
MRLFAKDIFLTSKFSYLFFYPTPPPTQTKTERADMSETTKSKPP